MIYWNLSIITRYCNDMQCLRSVAETLELLLHCSTGGSHLVASCRVVTHCVLFFAHERTFSIFLGPRYNEVCSFWTICHGNFQIILGIRHGSSLTFRKDQVKSSAPPHVGRHPPPADVLVAWGDSTCFEWYFIQQNSIHPKWWNISKKMLHWLTKSSINTMYKSVKSKRSNKYSKYRVKNVLSKLENVSKWFTKNGMVGKFEYRNHLQAAIPISNHRIPNSVRRDSGTVIVEKQPPVFIKAPGVYANWWPSRKPNHEKRCLK